MKEMWKDIKGYEGFYQVSNKGRIKSLISFNGHGYIKREKILKPQRNRYLTVRLAKCKNIKQYTIHRLVAEHFIENIENKPYINHKDCNKYNNSINNLEWCTAKENTNHAIKNNLITMNSERKRKAVLENAKKAWQKTRKKINQYDLEYNFIKEWESISQASRNTGIPYHRIENCCKGKSQLANGYKWDFV